MSRNNLATPGWEQSCRHSYALGYHTDIPGICNRRISYDKVTHVAQSLQLTGSRTMFLPNQRSAHK